MNPYELCWTIEALIIIIIKADDIEMGNIQVRKRKSMTLKNELSFLGTIHEASNNASQTLTC